MQYFVKCLQLKHWHQLGAFLLALRQFHPNTFSTQHNFSKWPLSLRQIKCIFSPNFITHCDVNYECSFSREKIHIVRVLLWEIDTKELWQWRRRVRRLSVDILSMMTPFYSSNFTYKISLKWRKLSITEHLLGVL